MVGVPGRSKGCKTCKQRKIACSLERPACRVCIKSNRECGGYQRERIFILDAKTQKDTHATPPKASAPALPPKCHVPESNGLAKPAPQELQGTISLKNAYTLLWTLNPTTRAIYREQIISEFLYSFVPNQKPEMWLTMLPSHPYFTSALEAASLAVCTAHLGRLNNSPTLVRESLKFYIQSLRELQKALWSDDLMYRDETLAACMLLIMYEVTECPDKTIGAWEGHMKGCAKLFETRGPDSFNDEFGHRLFNSFRQLEIQQAMVQRRETFLASPEWKEKPWKSRPKSITQQLLDVEVEISASIASVYTAPPTSSPEEFTCVLLDVLKGSWKLDAQLSAFYKRFESEATGSLYWPTPSRGFNHSIKISEDTDTDPPVFATAFQFPDLVTAHTCMLYWALTAILYSGMAKVYQILAAMQTQVNFQGQTTISSFMNPLPSSSSPSIPLSPSPAFDAATLNNSLSILSHLPSLGTKSDVSIPARNICQSLEYCMSSQQGTIAMTAAVLPLKIAIESFYDQGGCERELEWAKEVFGVVGGRGVEILRHLGVEVERKAYLPG